MLAQPRTRECPNLCSQALHSQAASCLSWCCTASCMIARRSLAGPVVTAGRCSEHQQRLPVLSRWQHTWCG